MTTLPSLTELVAPARGDLLYMVNDPASTPVDRKVAVQSLLAGPSPVIAASDSSDAAKRWADYVCDGTDDHVEIQAAIDAVAGAPLVGGIAASMGTVRMLRGWYNLAATIDLKQDVALMGDRGAYLKMVADVDGFNMKGGAQLSGFYFNVGAGYTSDAIKIDGSSKLHWPGNIGLSYRLPTMISDLIIRSDSLATGNAIHFAADETEDVGWVIGVQVRNVAIWQFHTGIRLAATNLDSQPANTVGGNQFENIYMWCPTYGCYMETALWEQVASNVFTNLKIYAHPAETIASVYCEGSHNVFMPAFFLDNIVPNKTLWFAGPAVMNRAYGILCGDDFIIQGDASNKLDDYFDMS
jgi:hypothetical protein